MNAVMDCRGDKFNEKHDCTVVALANAADVDYETAQMELRRYGRQPRHRFYFNDSYMSRAIRKKGSLAHGAEIVPHPKCTVKTFLPRIRKGRFIVEIRGHVFAVVDGVVFDNSQTLNERKRVIRAWQLR